MLIERTSETVVAENSPVTAVQRAAVSLPVTVTPRAELGQVIVRCCGAPTLTPTTDCPVPGRCGFTITQQISVEIPCTFQADVNSGTTRMSCSGLGNS